jgi:hypothetical protein
MKKPARHLPNKDGDPMKLLHDISLRTKLACCSCSEHVRCWHSAPTYLRSSR